MILGALQRVWWLATVAAVGFLIAMVPSAHADPTSPLCDDGSWQRAHPLICDTGGPLPSFGGGGGPVGGGGSDGGLIGRIIGAVGGVLGGLGL